MDDGTYHAGEIAVQERAGEREIARQRAHIVSRRIVAGALPFLSRQRILGLSVAGDDGCLWTTAWSGQPGFITSADGTHVSIRRSMMAASPDDPVLRRLGPGRDVGVLAIEFESRRRLRINGSIEKCSPDDIDILVRESVPNCPKYIQRRHPHEDAPPSSGRPTARGDALDGERRGIVERADTLFVGSLHPERGVDTSHRGGAPGFVRVADRSTLRVPDYAGNSMFLTLGNFAADDRAAVAVIDFDAAQILSLSGSARLQFGVHDPDHPTGGTGRYWEFVVREWIQFDLPSGARWEFLDASPFNPSPRRK